MIGFRTDIKINSELNETKIWKHIIKQWQKINRDYLEDYSFTDSLYWYNERANVSCLAGAIWKVGGYALEEYSAIKGKDEKYGRIDLYFSVDEIEYLIEAKHEWLHFNTKVKIFSNFEKAIENMLENATADCKNSMLHNEIDNGLGLVFFTPYWDKEQNKHAELKKFEYELLKKNYDIIGTFAIDAKDKKSKYNLNSSNNNTCNAVYIIGKYLSNRV